MEINYRIKTNGLSFIIERQTSWFSWKEQQLLVGGVLVNAPLDYFTSEFSTEKEAEKTANVAWGTSANRVREWRVI